MLIFIHNAFPTSSRINFIFCLVYKVFCISVSVISKLEYILCYIVFLYKYHKNSFEKKNQNRCQNWDFSYPNRMLV